MPHLGQSPGHIGQKYLVAAEGVTAAPSGSWWVWQECSFAPECSWSWLCPACWSVIIVGLGYWRGVGLSEVDRHTSDRYRQNARRLFCPGLEGSGCHRV